MQLFYILGYHSKKYVLVFFFFKQVQVLFLLNALKTGNKENSGDWLANEQMFQTTRVALSLLCKNSVYREIFKHHENLVLDYVEEPPPAAWKSFSLVYSNRQ